MPPLLSTEQPIRTRLLVSVRDPQEAARADGAGADLIDAKNPALGALGALPVDTVRAIVASLGSSTISSAVAGEPENAEDLVADVAAMASTGVDYVKVAVADDVATDALGRAAAAARGRLIGVLFAEDGVSSEIVPRLAEAGFCGAMIDTRGKDGRRLTDLLSTGALADFVSSCRRYALMSGLAGSLHVEDVPSLTTLAPDYLGFRGGLCLNGDRRETLDAARVAAAARLLRATGHRDAA